MLSSHFFVLTVAAAGVTAGTLTPDNTCGGTNGYICDPSLAQGGPCCSNSGYCGSSDAYCGTGCQSGFGTCSAAPSTSSNRKAKPSAAPSSFCGSYQVPGTGVFTNAANFTFLNTLPSGLQVSNYVVGYNPYAHNFTTSTVQVTSPYLSLLVPGGQHSSPYISAQIETTVTNILYASVRTTALFSSVAGTCHGLFFYKNDNQEIDIEYLTNRSAISNSFSSLPNQGGASTWTNKQKSRLPLHYTLQATTPGTLESTAFGVGAVNPANEEHEYRIDWTAGKVQFFLDGELQQTFTGNNVPTMPGSWLWNNWSNGDPGWSSGPPIQDNVLRIRSIEMYYNTTSSC